MTTVVDLIEGQVDAQPDALAIRAEDGEVTYRELDRLANRLAHAVFLTDPESTRPNVGVLLPCGMMPLVAMLAAAKTGRVLIALDESFPPERLAELLDQAGDAVVITDGAHQGFLPPGTPVVLMDELPARLPSTRPRVAIDPEQALQVTFTSGSTGRPKGALRTHKAQAHGARSRLPLGYGPGVRLGLVYDIAFAASRVTVWAGLVTGCSIHVRDVRKHGAADLAEWLGQEQIVQLAAPNSLIEAMLQFGIPDGALRTLEMVGFGGDVLRVSTVLRLRPHLSPTAVIRNSYGSSEMGGVTEMAVTADTVLDGELVPAGAPRKGVEVRIVDPDERGVGEIEVAGPMVSIGYVDKSTDRRGFHREGDRLWFRSGDLGRLRDDGLLEVLGRLDDRVKVRAQTIDPAEVELALLRLAEVADAHVTTREVRGERRLVAYIAPKHGARPTVSSVRGGLRPVIPDWMIPQSVVVLDPLPRTDRGKVDRPKLPVPGPERPELDVAFDPPKGPVECVVVETFESVLGVEGVGRDDEFFDLGGDSLNAVEVVVSLSRIIGHDLSLDAFRSTATPAAIAARLIHEPEGPEDRLVALQTSGSGTPVVFVHTGHGYVITMAPLAESTADRRPFYGVQMLHRDRPKDALSVPKLAQRYADLLDERVDGPVVIAGYSGGSRLAHGVAAELRSRGRDLVGLVLLDPPGPHMGHSASINERLALLHAMTGLRSPPAYRVRQRLAVSRFGGRRYDAQPLDAPIVVLRSELAEPHRWEPYTSVGVEVEDVPGNHVSMLYPPHLDVLAKVLEEVVRRLEGRQSAPSAEPGTAAV